MGPALKQFEGELARYFGTKHAIGARQRDGRLWLAFMALGIKPGDEIITTANTFFATAEAIWIAGRKAVLVDCDPKTRNIDPGDDRGGDHPAHAGPSSRCTSTGSAPT